MEWRERLEAQQDHVDAREQQVVMHEADLDAECQGFDAERQAFYAERQEADLAEYVLYLTFTKNKAAQQAAAQKLDQTQAELDQSQKELAQCNKDLTRANAERRFYENSHQKALERFSKLSNDRYVSLVIENEDDPAYLCQWVCTEQGIRLVPVEKRWNLKPDKRTRRTTL